MGGCSVGVPYTYGPSGELLTCTSSVLIEAPGEFLYLADRLPTYMVAAGWLIGLVLLLVAALVVKELLS